MGTILRLETLSAPKNLVVAILKDMTKEELESRYFESDMYRGDFGLSRVANTPCFVDETMSSNALSYKY